MEFFTTPSNILAFYEIVIRNIIKITFLQDKTEIRISIKY